MENNPANEINERAISSNAMVALHVVPPQKNPTNELNESLKTMFSFPTTNNEKTDEAIHAFASTANLLAQMVVRTGARYQEGSEAIKYLGLAFMHYRVGMERRPPDEKKEE